MNDNYLKLVVKLIKNQSVTDEEALILIKNFKNLHQPSDQPSDQPTSTNSDNIDPNFYVDVDESTKPKTNKDIQTDRPTLPKWLDKGIVWDKNTWTQKKNTIPFPFNPWETTYPDNINISDFPPGFNVTCETNSFHDEYKVPDKNK